MYFSVFWNRAVGAYVPRVVYTSTLTPRLRTTLCKFFLHEDRMILKLSAPCKRRLNNLPAYIIR